MQTITCCTNTTCKSKDNCALGFKEARKKVVRYVYFDTKGDTKCLSFTKKRYEY